ncbi:proton-coupled zinc antiporter SLC30A2-like isoform X3 [Epargyreus clarus]|uniref:proton-coupled zinc antiporter SLC30A2-like isoform X3 n=1 Tax=Epargyreus clarus TaxID=520877 RepID=UPI003C2DE39E
MTEDTKPLLLFKDGKATYGTESPARGRRVIFCVHGNPSTGCCAVIETTADGDDAGRNGSISEAERHCHRSRNEEIDKRARRKLIIASILCVIFMIGEIVGGYISNSLAIATDAAHLLTDFASFMISLFSLWVASRPATRRMPFGWYRAEVIGALTSVLLIWVVTGVLVYMAVQRVIYKEFEIDATVMLITSAVGVLVNLIMGLTLHQHGHSHGGGGHGHSHGGSNPVLNNKQKERADSDAESASSQTHAHSHAENINVRAAFIHVLGDFLQSFGVLVAAIVIYFQPEWNLVDPICTFLFSILVLITTFNIIKDTLLVLMEGSPRGLDFQDVANTFLSLPGVVRIHNLRMWALSLDKTALSAHLAIRSGVSPQKVLEEATRLVHEKYNFFEMTLQIEEFSDGMEDCSQCKMPQT